MLHIDELINAAQWGRLSAEEADTMRMELAHLRHRLEVSRGIVVDSERELRDYRTTNTRLVLENHRLKQELAEMEQQLRAVALHKFATAPVFHIPAELLDDDETPFPQ